MKQSRKRSSKRNIVPDKNPSSVPPAEDEPEHPSYGRAQGKQSHKVVDRQQLAFEIEIGICEVDKIFEGQGDKLGDAFVIESLDSLTKLIKDTTYENYADKLKEGSDNESDMLHINIVNRLSSIVEELELQVTDDEIIEAMKQVLSQIKKAKSAKLPRAYLDPLAKRLKEMGFKSDLLAETNLDGDTIRLEDIDDLDDLGLDDDDLDLEDFRPKY
ncbi:MAG: hypothetical protein ACLP05_10160 [Candidatus Kryptoniota bacterium]